MAFLIEQHIFRLEISVDNIVFMEVGQSLDEFSSVDPDSLFREPLFLPEVGEEFSSVDEVEDEVELGLRLEGVVQTHNVMTLCFLKNISLGCNC